MVYILNCKVEPAVVDVGARFRSLIRMIPRVLFDPVRFDCLLHPS